MRRDIGRRGDAYRHGDAGVSLLEVVVAMALMAVFTAMFTAAVTGVFRAATGVESAATAQSQLHQAFLRLDREIRYAESIAAPGQVGADWYVEYHATNTGTPRCTQLRLQAGADLLRHRTWTAGATPGPWTTLAAGVTAPAGSDPFTLTPATGPGFHPQLRVALVAAAGADAAAVAKQSRLTFTALNSLSDSAQVGACTAERPTS